MLELPKLEEESNEPQAPEVAEKLGVIELLSAAAWHDPAATPKALALQGGSSFARLPSGLMLLTDGISIGDESIKEDEELNRSVLRNEITLSNKSIIHSSWRLRTNGTRSE
jgi:hypothetical protein